MRDIRDAASNQATLERRQFDEPHLAIDLGARGVDVRPLEVRRATVEGGFQVFPRSHLRRSPVCLHLRTQRDRIRLQQRLTIEPKKRACILIDVDEGVCINVEDYDRLGGIFHERSVPAFALGERGLRESRFGDVARNDDRRGHFAAIDAYGSGMSRVPPLGAVGKNDLQLAGARDALGE